MAGERWTRALSDDGVPGLGTIPRGMLPGLADVRQCEAMRERLFPKPS